MYCPGGRFQLLRAYVPMSWCAEMHTIVQGGFLRGHEWWQKIIALQARAEVSPFGQNCRNIR